MPPPPFPELSRSSTLTNRMGPLTMPSAAGIGTIPTRRLTVMSSPPAWPKLLRPHANLRKPINHIQGGHAFLDSA